ncbi:PP2C family protein-serine/threonine phosphatase [Streptomyces sp. NBRC 110035]|uniref:PP2C family protein-serine/threonine phosphatase n=1 Tax=Streptomyces sp. NBRC 110035 TaxID=1547867 RepID=UPI0005A606D4|nr:GAF domain-containing SpoIIE family protein phosphatase [Streptomyces sp. NBRC 110035]
MTSTWQISGVTGAARARAALARLAARHGVPAVERARLAAALGVRLRQCLAEGGTWRLTLDVHRTKDGGDALHAVLAPPADASVPGQRPWETTIPFSPVHRPRADSDSDSDSDTVPGDVPAVLSQSLLSADEDTALVLDRLAEQEALVAFHREELHQTNQGVLALHAELDAAGRAQQEAFAAERRARNEAENARRRLTFLADASAVLNTSLNHGEILRRLPELLVPRYAARVDVWLFDEDDGPHRPPPRPAAAVRAARTGRPQYAADHPGGLRGVDDQPPSKLDAGRPLLCVPLLTRQAPLGVLTLSSPGERWDPDDAVMLLELARRAGIAIDNARRFEHNRDIAETLQLALLTDLPTTPGMSLAARYLPATHGMNIGGDWYDAFHRPDGSLITVVGDVTGHGLHAAVMMSQLRTALRAYAVDGGSPGRLLTRLHGFLHQLQPHLYATAVIARFHPDEATLTWAAAGHPPPVLRLPDGRVRTLDAKPGAMLGIPLEQEIADHTEQVAPGSTLALYTDGLVERRVEGIDSGIGRLADALGSFGPAELDTDLEDAADRLLNPLLRDSERDDDVCLLLCHLHR